MKRSKIAFLIGGPVLALIAGAVLFSSGRIIQPRPFDRAVSEARYLIQLSLIYEAHELEDSQTIVSLEDALSQIEREAYRQELRSMIDDERILFFPPRVPVRDNPVVAIVRWKDYLITIDGEGRTHEYRAR